MGYNILIMGEPGTGKTFSIRNCNPLETVVINPLGKPLPFPETFETLDGVCNARDICNFIGVKVAEGKKLFIIDDFQYTLSIPYMGRIHEGGWDKYNDFTSNYFDIINYAKSLPDDVTVVFMSHVETLENGVTTVKLIGKLLREKITIEGLFPVVLKTGVSDGEYFFYTQNSGHDTTKSPFGMFQDFTIPNDLRYVCDRVRGRDVSPIQMSTPTPIPAVALDPIPENLDTPTRPVLRKKVLDSNPVGAKGSVDTLATPTSPTPVTSDPGHRTRRERTESMTLDHDAYFYDARNNTYVMKRTGETVDVIVGSEIVMQEITKDEFDMRALK